MLNIIYFMISLLISGGVLKWIEGNIGNEPFITLCVVSVITFIIWGCIILYSIHETIRDQLYDKYSILKEEKGKQSRIEEMAAYKDEMQGEGKQSRIEEMAAYKDEIQEEMLEKYREFESTLMNSVKDSKLVATVLKQNGYSTVLDSYNEKIRAYLSYIHGCDRSIDDYIRCMMIRQNNFILGYSLFIPKNLFYDKEK